MESQILDPSLFYRAKVENVPHVTPVPDFPFVGSGAEIPIGIENVHSSSLEPTESHKLTPRDSIMLERVIDVSNVALIQRLVNSLPNPSYIRSKPRGLTKANYPCCYRCGHRSHYADECFATYNVYGGRIRGRKPILA